MPLVFTRLRISCLTMIDIIPMLFLISVCFQKLNRRTGALPTVEWSPATKAKFGAVLTLEYMSEEESDPKQAPAETHRHSFGLGKPRTARAEASIGRARDGHVNGQG